MKNLPLKYLLVLFFVVLALPVYGQTVKWVQMNRPVTAAMPANGLLFDGKTLFAATKNGLYLTTDGGVNWSVKSGRLGSIGIDEFFQSDTVLFLTTETRLSQTDTRDLYRSNDGVITWDTSRTGYGYFLSSKKGIIFVETIFGPATYVELNDGTGGRADPGDYRLSIIAFGMSDDFVIGVLDSIGKHKDSVVSIDFFSSWKRVPLIDGYIAIDGNKFFACTKNGIYRSDDTCQTWYLINPNITDAYFLIKGKLILAISRTQGILYSIDHGDSWTPMNNGLPDFNISNIAFGNNEIYAGLQSGDLYHTVMPSDVNSPRSQPSNQLTVYPNPSSFSSTISYSLSTSGNVSLTIYDALGRVVEIPVNEIQDAGSHQISISIKTPGIYNCRLKTAVQDAFVKMIVQ